MIYSTLHKLKISHFIGKHLFTERSFVFRFFYWFVKKVSWTQKVDRNGHEVILLLRHGVGVLNFMPDYETWLDKLIPSLIQSREAAFIDVGANTGQTLLKVLPKYPDIPYYAIEPNPICANYLEELCETNDFHSVRIVNQALADHEQEAELLLRYQDDVLATTSPNFRTYTQYARKIRVGMTTGDQLLLKYPAKKIGVIKIDVEGGEVGVVRGFKNTIAVQKPLVICEILPLMSKSAEVTTYRNRAATQLLQLFDQLSYRVLNLHTKKQICSIKDLSSSLESSNYIALHSERHLDALR